MAGDETADVGGSLFAALFVSGGMLIAFGVHVLVMIGLHRAGLGFGWLRSYAEMMRQGCGFRFVLMVFVVGVAMIVLALNL